MGMNPPLAPGVFVRNPERPDWGLGQVQSALGDCLTVNFEHAGKLAINARVVPLEPGEPDVICQDLDIKPRHPLQDPASAPPIPIERD
jgi:hypothetical protein